MFGKKKTEVVDEVTAADLQSAQEWFDDKVRVVKQNKIPRDAYLALYALRMEDMEAKAEAVGKQNVRKRERLVGEKKKKVLFTTSKALCVVAGAAIVGFGFTMNPLFLAGMTAAIGVGFLSAIEIGRRAESAACQPHPAVQLLFGRFDKEVSSLWNDFEQEHAQSLIKDRANITSVVPQLSQRLDQLFNRESEKQRNIDGFSQGIDTVVQGRSLKSMLRRPDLSCGQGEQ